MINSEPKAPIQVPVNFTDIRAGIRHDATIARREGFKGVAERAELLLDLLETAEREAHAQGPYTLALVFSFPA